MGDVKLTFQDGNAVRLHLVPVSGVVHDDARAGARATGDPDPSDQLELPADYGTAEPVSVGSRTSQALTRGGEALTEALQPLGGVLQGIHHSFARFAQCPDEVTVEFGVTLGSDLSLGVFSGSGEASFTVSATWNLTEGRTAGTTEGVAIPADGALPTGVPDTVHSAADADVDNSARTADMSAHRVSGS